MALLRADVHPREAERLDAQRNFPIASGEPHHNLRTEAQAYEGFLMALDQELEQHPEDVLQPALPAKAEVPTAGAPGAAPGRVVFIVHGHDEVNLQRLKELLKDRWKLDPRVLSREAGRGRTLSAGSTDGLAVSGCAFCSRGERGSTPTLTESRAFPFSSQ